MPKVFISYNYKDQNAKSSVDNWTKQNIGSDISFFSEDGESHSIKGHDFVKNLLRTKIDTAQILLAVVGDDSYNRPWVDFEVKYAASKGIKVIWTQIKGTTGAPPIELRSKSPIAFTLEAIQKAIREA